MPIIVNLDIMMARRKISLGELAEKIDPQDIAGRAGGEDRPHPRQPLHPEDGESQGRALLHARSHLPCAGLPAGGFAGVSGGIKMPHKKVETTTA